MKVVNCTLYADNPYQKLLYSATDGQFSPVRGSIDDAIQILNRAEGNILHVHWEEHLVRSSPTSIEAKGRAEYFLNSLNNFINLGGIVIWTIHNETPHELQHVEAFLALRRGLAKAANLIFVHNLAAIEVLSHQVDVDRRKIYLIQHPSYSDFYEDVSDTRAALLSADSRQLLCFGMIREYKGFHRLKDIFADGFLAKNNATLRISGASVPGDSYADQLATLFNGDEDVVLDFRNVAESEVAGLFHDSAAVLLPYNRFLTSGVALLALTFGSLIIAPNVIQMRETIPRAGWDLLYDPSSEDDMRRAIAAALNMSPEERLNIRSVMLDRAEYLHPSRIGREFYKVLANLAQTSG